MGNTTSKELIIPENVNIFTIYPPIIQNRVVGKSCVNFAYLDILIDELNHGSHDIGQIIKFEVFKDYPDFAMKIGFTSGKPRRKIGDFANPKSHWFNTILGVIKIEACWEERPFGFTSLSEICKIDLFLLCKAIWNFIVNYLYGVPIKECVNYTQLDGDEEISMVRRDVKIGEHEYIELNVNNIVTTTGYKYRASLINNSSILTPLWQKVLGRPRLSRKFSQSFPYARMQVKLFIRYEKSYDGEMGKRCYCTYIKLASVNTQVVNEEMADLFLQAQIDGLTESVIEL